MLNGVTLNNQKAGNNEGDMYYDINRQSSLSNDKSQSLPNITDDVFFNENVDDNERQSEK